MLSSTLEIFQSEIAMQASLGASLLAASVLIFLIWYEPVRRLGFAQKQAYLLHPVRGSFWIFSVLLFCAGTYCLLSTIS